MDINNLKEEITSINDYDKDIDKAQELFNNINSDKHIFFTQCKFLKDYNSYIEYFNKKYKYIKNIYLKQLGITLNSKALKKNDALMIIQHSINIISTARKISEMNDINDESIGEAIKSNKIKYVAKRYNSYKRNT